MNKSVIKIVIIILISLFVLNIIRIVYVSVNTEKKIKANRGNTVGEIIEVEEDGRGCAGLVYSYQVKGTTYQKRSTTSICKCEKKFKGKKFPVVYNKDNPKYSLIIVSLPDFIDWNILYEKKYYWSYKCISLGDVFKIQHQDQIPDELKGTDAW